MRGRERERDACDVIDITLKSRVIMHMITSTARVPNASTRSEPVERSNFEVHVKTRSLALERSIEQQGRVIDERRWGSGSFAFAAWSDCRGSPSSSSLACFKQEE